MTSRVSSFGLVAVLGAAAAAAQEPDTTRVRAAETKRIHQTVVVTGSRTEEVVQDAPAAMSVIPSAAIENAPADDYGELLRTVPGLNVAQMSARDVQIVGRGATSSLATSQLVLVDGRTIYLDFFGFVMWDFLPINTREIRQIEVVRGPGSAVWGANALTGVVNLITKSPRELAGTQVVAGGGEWGTGYATLTHAGARGRASYKLSGGFYSQDPFDRPAGRIPGRTTPYPPFGNEGTKQPKVDVRLDFEADAVSRWTVAGGFSGTDGILHSGIGPFDIDSGTFLSYGRAQYERRALRAGFFANVLDGDATNLLTSSADGNPISFAFATQTYNLDASNSTAVGQRNVFTYGATGRFNTFDLSIAPRGDDRREIGAFVQDDVLLLRRAGAVPEVRCVAGVRWDDIDPIGSVFSPRTSLLVSPHADHTLRLSFNRAFRAPSVVQNYLETSIVNQVVLPVPPSGLVYRFPSEARGNPDLGEEQMTAFEVGYVGTFAERMSLSLAVYRNELDDNIDFYPRTFYSAADPPPGWPLPPAAVPPNQFPKSFSYRNIGEIVNRGVEASLDIAATDALRLSLNYSFQDEPETKGIAASEINTPPTSRCNFGASYDERRWFLNSNIHFVDDAFWTDVLDARFWGPTPAFVQVNAGAGVRFWDGRAQVSVLATNLLDVDIQQHVFGDILSRKALGEIRVTY